MMFYSTKHTCEFANTLGLGDCLQPVCDVIVRESGEDLNCAGLDRYVHLVLNGDTVEQAILRREKRCERRSSVDFIFLGTEGEASVLKYVFVECKLDVTSLNSIGNQCRDELQKKYDGSLMSLSIDRQACMLYVALYSSKIVEEARHKQVRRAGGNPNACRYLFLSPQAFLSKYFIVE